MHDAKGAEKPMSTASVSLSRDSLLRAAALLENRLPEAASLLRERLKNAPDDPDAIRMFAELAMKSGRDDEAERLLARCLELAPGFHVARLNYAQALNRNGKYREALNEVESLLAVAPTHPGYRNLKAVILCRISDYAPRSGSTRASSRNIRIARAS